MGTRVRSSKLWEIKSEPAPDICRKASPVEICHTCWISSGITQTRGHKRRHRRTVDCPDSTVSAVPPPIGVMEKATKIKEWNKAWMKKKNKREEKKKSLQSPVSSWTLDLPTVLYIYLQCHSTLLSTLRWTLYPRDEAIDNPTRKLRDPELNCPIPILCPHWVCRVCSATNERTATPTMTDVAIPSTLHIQEQPLIGKRTDLRKGTEEIAHLENFMMIIMTLKLNQFNFLFLK